MEVKMLLELNTSKWLVKDALEDTEQLTYTGKGKATKKEVEDLKELDKENLQLYGFHLIKNYEDLNN